MNKKLNEKQLDIDYITILNDNMQIKITEHDDNIKKKD